MAEAEVRSDFDGVPVETFTYSAGSYDRLKSNEGYFKTMAKTVSLIFFCYCCLEELFELVRLSEVPIDKELFKVVC